MSELIPAATAVLLRDGEQGLEVLLLRRSKALVFGGGFWVFPGGRIDLEDYPADKELEQAAKNAVVREIKEEAQLTVNTEELIFKSHWFPPKEIVRRFTTWFFIAAYQRDESVVVDEGEIDQYRWLGPQQALNDFSAQRIKIMPPTFVSLTELSRYDTVAQALAYYQSREAVFYAAGDWRQYQQGRCVLFGGDAGYDDNDPTAEGRRHRLVELNGQWQYLCDT